MKYEIESKKCKNFERYAAGIFIAVTFLTACTTTKDMEAMYERDTKAETVRTLLFCQ